MAKILIAEDDEFLRETLKDYLNSKGHQVFGVPNGKVAREVVLTGEFDLIVSDVQMPFLNGVELLQWLREISKLPFILMTGFTNLLETQKAAEFGADGFLSKPFSNKDLLKLITEILEPPKPKVEAPVTDEPVFCKVNIDEFVARPKIEFDIYVHLPGGKYLKVAHQGETLDIGRLKSYKDKGVTHLHIREEDFSKLVGFNMEVAKVLQSTCKVDPEKKARFMRYTSEVILENCYARDIDKESFQDATRFVEVTMNVMTDSKPMFDLLNVLNDHADYIYAHSLGVSIYSVLIAKNMNYDSSQTLFKLAMSGLFHDIGKKEIERSILDKARPLLSATERKLYESHVGRGREIMELIPGTPSEVLQIITEHHEDETETGYPLGTPHLRLHPLSRIVHLADIFVTRCLKSPHSQGISANEAIRLIEQFDMDRVNKVAFSALKSLIQIKKIA